MQKQDVMQKQGVMQKLKKRGENNVRGCYVTTIVTGGARRTRRKEPHKATKWCMRASQVHPAGSRAMPRPTTIFVKSEFIGLVFTKVKLLTHLFISKEFFSKYCKLLRAFARRVSIGPTFFHLVYACCCSVMCKLCIHSLEAVCYAAYMLQHKQHRLRHQKIGY